MRAKNLRDEMKEKDEIIRRFLELYRMVDEHAERHEEEMEKLQEEHEEEYNAKIDKHEEEMERMEKRHEQEAEELESKLERELDDLKEKYSDLFDLESKYMNVESTE